MKICLLHALISLLFIGCASEPSNLSANPRTLGGSRGLPQDEIAEFYLPKDWPFVRAQEYSGYVVMTGLFDPSGKVQNVRIVRSFPDASGDQLARDFSKDVKIQSLMTGSWIWPTAEVYVIFYESIQEKRAIIYAKRDDYLSRSSYRDSRIQGSFGSGPYFRSTVFSHVVAQET